MIIHQVISDTKEPASRMLRVRSFHMVLWGMFALIAASCSTGKEADADYIATIDQWHNKRLEALRSERGWLNIAGLFWLKPGINTFGSGQDNNLIFPSTWGVQQAGYFMLSGDTVSQVIATEGLVTSNGMAVKESIAFNPDSTRQPIFESGTLRWFVIRRDNRFGVRLRDLNHPNLKSFEGIDRFPVDAEYRVNAKWEPTPGKTIPITNVLGQTTQQPAPGTLIFSLNDVEYRLDALDEGGDELFIIFGDATNARTTYGAGRYLYVPKPGTENSVIVDFNKAENPPCAFTEFATCPLPPIQNVLDIDIKAGEKNYDHH
ncbi:MAG: DUF1684 domain-containing protein [Cyclobacteriaceae bacterium]|nr:DUF1684 domain-containing protein [Cyclobacteriaceae bacterium]